MFKQIPVSSLFVLASSSWFGLSMNFFVLRMADPCLATSSMCSRGKALEFDIGKAGAEIVQAFLKHVHIAVTRKLLQWVWTHQCVIYFDFKFIMNELNQASSTNVSKLWSFFDYFGCNA